jgi:hypothetical protein
LQLIIIMMIYFIHLIYARNMKLYQTSRVIPIIRSNYQHKHILFPFNNKINARDETECTVSVQQLSRDSVNTDTKYAAAAPQHSVIPSGNHAWQTVDRPIIARTR